MQITIQIKLLPTHDQAVLLQETAKEYISLVNDIVDYALGQGRMPRLSSALVSAPLPSTLRAQAIQDARAVYRKCCKTHIQHILRKPVIIWNNQNYTVGDGYVSVPLQIGGRTHRCRFLAETTPEILDRLSAYKLGTLRVTRKNKKWIAQIAVEQQCASLTDGSVVMGIDLNLKCPAVAATTTGKVKFAGNGRQNKYVRRKFKSRRRKLGKAKKLDAIRRAENKEQRWMKDQDHKISRAMVNFAVQNNVSEIRLERLEGIRKTTRISRKNEKNLHTWSFYRTAQYIEYKAAMAGIRVTYVDPAFTSQLCPVCGTRHKMKDRRYRCSTCGYHGHRDIVGAINIIHAPVVDGNSLPA